MAGHEPYFSVKRGLRRRTTRLIVVGVLVIGFAAVALVVLRRGSSQRVHWPPVPDPLYVVRVKAVPGTATTILNGRIVITVQAVTPEQVTADVQLNKVGALRIVGGVGSKFRPKGDTVEIQVSDLNDRYATFLVTASTRP